MAAERRKELRMPRDAAARLGLLAVDTCWRGRYRCETGREVLVGTEIEAALASKVSIPPGTLLPKPEQAIFEETVVQVANETTFGAARRLMDRGLDPLALNFANGIHPGGGFLQGDLSQEEVLCRSSALYATLEGDPMYQAHRERHGSDWTDWAILSPKVPVFRTDSGRNLAEPWTLSFLTCAAPIASEIGQPESGNLLAERIRRVLEIARTYGYTALVLGAWGCGAFRNDPQRTAADFRRALEREYAGAFSDVVFAITDWSPERRFLGPFRKVFAHPQMEDGVKSERQSGAKISVPE